MALNQITTAEINTLLIAQLEASLNQTFPLLPKAFNRVIVKALSAVITLLIKYGGFIFLQIFVATASFDEVTINGKKVSPLIEWGRLIGVGDPTPATQAELQIQITVENQTGSLPTGSQLVNAGNGVTYLTIGSVLLDAPTVTATIRASSDQQGGGGAGTIGNLDNGATVTFANPLPNVAPNAVVTNQIVTGANGEDPEVYRQRVIDRFQKRPQGGAYADYEIWGEEVAGIINVYPYTGDPGQVNVYSEATPESSGDPDGIPTAAQLQAVYDSIQLDENGLATRRPAGSFVNSLAITRTGFDVNVQGLAVDDPGQVQADIGSAITTFFLDREPFIDGLTIPPRKDTISRSALIGLVEDIVTAANGFFSTVTFELDAIPGPLEIYILGEGEKSKAVDITFT